MSARIIAIDWSGALNHPERKIWRAEFGPGIEPHIADGFTREGIIDYLIQIRDLSPIIIGLDFAFSCPAWFVREQGCNSAMEFWNLVELRGEEWLKGCPSPFWGRYRVKRPQIERDKFLRQTEKNLQSVGGIVPKSVFQLAGSGHVGTGSLRGMPFLKQLRENGFSIWPFDAHSERTVIEIYPRILTEKVNKRKAESRAKFIDAACFNSFGPRWREKAVVCEDAFDAAVSAYRMQECQMELNALKSADDPAILLEGMIWTPKNALQ